LNNSASQFHFLFKNDDQVEIWSQLAEKCAKRKDIFALLGIDFFEDFQGSRHLVSRIATDLLILYLELNGKIEPCTYTVFRKLMSYDQGRVIRAIFKSKVVGISGLYRWKEIMQIRMPAFSVIMSSDLLKGPGDELILDYAFQNSCLFFEQRDILRYWNAHLSVSERYICCLNAFQAVFRAESLFFLEQFL
jgi:hypothetical protein